MFMPPLLSCFPPNGPSVMVLTVLTLVIVVVVVVVVVVVAVVVVVVVVGVVDVVVNVFLFRGFFVVSAELWSQLVLIS